MQAPEDHKAKELLAVSSERLICRPSSSERNNCLIDSTLQALIHCGILNAMSPGDRRQLHLQVRTWLQEQGLVSYPDGSRYYPMLAKDEHFPAIVQWLAEERRTVCSYRRVVGCFYLYGFLLMVF